MSHLKVKESIYHVGDASTVNGLDCNPYMIIEGEEAVLFDPGSVLDFETVLENIKELISLDKIKYIVLHHQDPDFCSAVPLLEKAGVEATIITSWRTMTLIQYYGIQSPLQLIEEHDMKLKLKNGRILEFIPTPYLHFAGAFVTYDKKEKLLFSSDLFGAFSYNRTMYADDNYLNKMLSFHEHYMPSNSVLRPVMDIFLTYDIEMILPQHGSIINSRVKDYIMALRTLECGTMLAPLKKNLMQSGGYTMIFNEIYKRLFAVFAQDEVTAVFKTMENIVFDDLGEIVNYHTDGEKVFNEIFKSIKEQKGVIWLTVVETAIRNICAVYDLEMPAIFSSAITEMVSENIMPQEANRALDQTIKSVNDKLVRCPVTGLYNEVFLKSLLLEELNTIDWRDVGALVSIGIDDFSKYQFAYGQQEEENVLKNLAYMFKETFGENSVYRLDYTEFALYVKGIDKDTLIDRLEKLRISISKSELFLGKITISAGIAFANEIKLDEASYDLTLKEYMNLSITRLRIAKIKGKNMICYYGEENQSDSKTGTVLVVDSDETNLELIKNFLEYEGIFVSLARDGVEAYEIAAETKPKVIISEVILNKLDGFVLREQILENSSTKDIETVFMSYKKDEESVQRAMELGVTYYLKKPYILSELVGIVKRKAKGIIKK